MSARGLVSGYIGLGSNEAVRTRVRRGPSDCVRETNRRRLDGWVLLALAGVLLFLTQPAMAGITASISGTVRDFTGAAMMGATVTARNTDTGITETRLTNDHGFYSFQALPLGRYDIEVQQAGFKVFRQTGVVLDVNSALIVDAFRLGRSRKP